MDPIIRAIYDQSPLMTQSGHGLVAPHMSAFGSKADAALNIRTVRLSSVGTPSGQYVAFYITSLSH